VLIYLLLALGAGAGLVFNARLPPMLAQALAPTGAMFALLTLWSGSLWARPVLGVWWVWDTHLISEFVLLSLYAGFIVLQTGMDDAPKGDKFGAALAIAGIVNVPINVLSVEWWTTLHQGVSISSSSQPGMTTSMLAGTLVMAAAFFLYSCAVAMLRLRCVILERERDSEWVAKRGNASP
jgi:heme exporter protein C